MANPIHQEVVFQSNPQRIYEALMDAKQHSAFSGGAPAEISRDVGGAWSAFGGHIFGRNLELVPNRRIVQGWRSRDWPEGVYSVVRFELKPEGSGTRVILDQAGFPEGGAAHLSDGWNNMYWEPLRKYLA